MRITVLALFAMLICTLARATPPTVNYTGHYELADTKTGTAFSLDLTQTGSKAEFSFSAAMSDGSGAAPDGDGKGHLDKNGVLIFTFSDSFENEGTGTLEHKKDGYRLTLNVTKVAEPRPLRFYGDVLLKKTSDKPSP